MTAPARQAWWNKKRWAAALGLSWLTVGYPLLLGPLTYAHFRGWVSTGSVLTAHEPVRVALMSLPRGRVRDKAIECNGAYVDWWVRLGETPPAPGPAAASE